MQEMIFGQAKPAGDSVLRLPGMDTQEMWSLIDIQSSMEEGLFRKHTLFLHIMQKKAKVKKWSLIHQNNSRARYTS